MIKLLYIKHVETDTSKNKKVYVSVPNKCPICHSNISPNYIDHIYSFDTDLLSVFWECTACFKTFLSYNYEPSIISTTPSDYELYPKFSKQHIFDDAINNISPNFQEIYNQAAKAESDNLDQICGMGYRKALEFLIKDYCIYRNPNNQNDIKVLQLGQVINNYIDSTKIKNLAKVSAWLGNDETHYVRKYTDKDINDLKRFIDTTVHFISYELLSDEADNMVSSK